MILNSGLDAACTNDANYSGGTFATALISYFCGFIRYAAFGTGSTAPSVTDTGLDAQVGVRSNSRGGFANTQDAGLDPNNNVAWYETTFTRVFDIASNVNATEWGLAPAATGSLSVRELFRADPNDNNSSPITLTLEDGDQLQLVVTFRVQANWEYESKSFTITRTSGNDANGKHTGNATFSSGATSTLAVVRDSLRAVWPGGGYSNSWGHVKAFLSDQSDVGKGEDMSAAAGNAAITSGETYNPSDYYRDGIATFTTDAVNGNHYAWSCTEQASTGSASSSQGLRFILTDPPYLTKASTHRLSLTVRKSISRL